MKFIMVSECGDGIGLLQRIREEGNEVELFIHDKTFKDMWEGLIPKAESLPLEKDAIYIFDMSGMGDVAEKLISRGYYVVGGSKEADDMELKRGDAMDVMHNVSIPIPETHTFTKFEEGIKFVKDHSKDRWVFKVSGDDLPPSLSYCQGEDEELLPYVEYVQHTYGNKIKEIEFQEFIEGVAVSTEGFFNGNHFVRPFNHTIENKKYGNSNLGQSTGCQGNVMWICEEDVLTRHLQKIEPVLKDKYIGPVDINMMVSERGEYALEWTPRFGYDALPALLRIYEGDIASFLYKMAHRVFDGEMELSYDFGAAIRATVPPYPYYPMKGDKLRTPCGLPIQIGDNWDDYYFYGVRLDEDDGGIVVADTQDGVVLCGLGNSSDFTESIEICEKVLEEVKIPDLYYRTDLGDYLSRDYEQFNEIMESKEEKSNA